MSFLRRLRVEAAQTLILRTPSAEIDRDPVGFADEFHFSRASTKSPGQAPGASENERDVSVFQFQQPPSRLEQAFRHASNSEAHDLSSLLENRAVEAEPGTTATPIFSDQEFRKFTVVGEPGVRRYSVIT